MNVYQVAARKKLRFDTSRGFLTVEQLFDLKLTTLSALIREQKAKVVESSDSDDLDFLTDKIKADDTEQLRFDVLKDIYLTLKAEKEASDAALSAKEHNQKVLALINRKQEKQMEDLSVEELEKLLK